MGVIYHGMRAAWKFIFLQTMRRKYVGPARLPEGGFVLAVTHISHLECVCTGLMTRRQIHWIARREFYANWFLTWLLNSLGCIRVNRQGISVSAIRLAIRHVSEGRIVGIFPEGGVVKGKELAIRGGSIKRGAASIAIHGQVPIVPCVVLGVEKLTKVRPWLPFWRGRLWIAQGDPIRPPAKSTRRTRDELTVRLLSSYRDLYARLQSEFGIRDCDVP